MEIMKRVVWMIALATLVVQAQAAEGEPVDQAAIEECIKKGIEERKRDHARDSAERRKRGLQTYRPYDTKLVRPLCEARAKAAPIMKNTPWK